MDKRILIDVANRAGISNPIPFVDDVISLAYYSGDPMTSPPETGKTKGSWVMDERGRELRPDSRFDYDIIERMRKSGIIAFATVMKLSEILNVFKVWRNLSVHTLDKDFKDIASVNLQKVLPNAFVQAGYTSLVYGFAPLEMRWFNATPYELGLSEQKGGKIWSVMKDPYHIDPKTIKSIIRDPKDHSFGGFVQANPLYPRFSENQKEEIEVGLGRALILSYNERNRNMFGESFLEPAYAYWYWYEVVLRSIVRVSESSGIPMKKMFAPLGGGFEDPKTKKQVPALKYMATLGENMANSTYVTLPSDRDENGNLLYDIMYMDPQVQSIAPLVTVLQELSQLIIRSLMSADRSLTQSSGGVGSYNIGELHAQATSNHNQMTLLSWINQLNKHMLPLMSHYNYGKGGPPLELQLAGVDRSIRQQLVSLIQGAGNHTKAPWDLLDWRGIASMADLPILSEEEAEKVKKEREEAEQKALENQQKAMKEASKGESPEENEKEDEEKEDDGKKPNLMEMFSEVDTEQLSGFLIPLITENLDENRSIELTGKKKFDENKVKRDKNGRFAGRKGSGGGGGSGSSGGKLKAQGKEFKKANFKERLGEFKKELDRYKPYEVPPDTLNSSHKEGTSVSQEEGAKIKKDLEKKYGLDDIRDHRKMDDLAKKSVSDFYGGKEKEPTARLTNDKTPATALAMYNPQAKTISINSGPRGLNSPPMMRYATIHERLHEQQDVNGLSIGDVNDDARSIQGKISFIEGQNDLMTMRVMSKSVNGGKPMTHEQLAVESQKWRETNDISKGKKNVKVSNKPFYVGYPRQSEAFAGMLDAAAKNTGKDKTKMLEEAHKDGFNDEKMIGLLTDAFGERASNRWTKSRLRGKDVYNTPTLVEIEDWLKEDGIDSKKSYNDIVGDTNYGG